LASFPAWSVRARCWSSLPVRRGRLPRIAGDCAALPRACSPAGRAGDGLACGLDEPLGASPIYSARLRGAGA
jgi:hypothetical protein